MIKADISYEADLRYWNTVARGEIVDIACRFARSVEKLVKVVRRAGRGAVGRSHDC